MPRGCVTGYYTDADLATHKVDHPDRLPPQAFRSIPIESLCRTPAKFAEWLAYVFRRLTTDSTWPKYAHFVLDWLRDGAFEFVPGKPMVHLGDNKMREADVSVPWW